MLPGLTVFANASAGGCVDGERGAARGGVAAFLFAERRRFRIGDAVASRNVHAVIYDALRLCKDL